MDKKELEEISVMTEVEFNKQRNDNKNYARDRDGKYIHDALGRRIKKSDLSWLGRGRAQRDKY